MEPNIIKQPTDSEKEYFQKGFDEGFVKGFSSGLQTIKSAIIGIFEEKKIKFPGRNKK